MVTSGSELKGDILAAPEPEEDKSPSLWQYLGMAAVGAALTLVVLYSLGVRFQSQESIAREGVIKGTQFGFLIANLTMNEAGLAYQKGNLDSANVIISEYNKLVRQTDYLIEDAPLMWPTLDMVIVPPPVQWTFGRSDTTGGA